MKDRKRLVIPDTGGMTVGALSELLEEKGATIVKYLMTDLGVMASMTQSIDNALCVKVAEGLGRIVVNEEDYDVEEEDSEIMLEGFVDEEDDPLTLLPRPPVITVMGHVDHGKTSLLDALRQSQVADKEAGGITQHIAAYQVSKDDNLLTFVDTPGHAAFGAMRERGANLTDIVILVVAADDGVKQQTVDSIVCAKKAKVPLLVAINKCDLETKDIARVQSELAQYDVLTEDYGGQVLCQEISAKENQGLDQLLEKVLLQAELQDLKANPDRLAQGIVVEARVEKGLGTVATVLVQKGTLKIGDPLLAGLACGKVRALVDQDGNKLTEAPPSTPVTVTGWDGLPSAGDLLVVPEDEATARDVVDARKKIFREASSSTYQANLMDTVTASFQSGGKQHRTMCVVVKADVQGNAEALAKALQNLVLEDDEAKVTINVLVAEAGDVTKTDMAIASVTPMTQVISFNSAATKAAMDDARMFNIPIEYYSVVYDAIDSVESKMQEVLSPTPEGEYVGSAIVQEIFNIGGTGNIAGSKCRDGIIKKGSNVRIMRGDKILVQQTIVTSLRNFKAEVDNIKEGEECGVGVKDFEEFKEGDILESYVFN